MASYKQPCLQCGAFIDRDAQFCPMCGSQHAFGYRCPTCLRDIVKGQRLCADCGRALYVHCPHCQQLTFVQEKCEHCGGSLLVPCTNHRCGALQFFENTKCTACGKKIKIRRR